MTRLAEDISREGIKQLRFTAAQRAAHMLSWQSSKTADDLRERCRQGNPFPLVAYQWPDLLIHDSRDERYFKGEIGNAENPCLRLDDWQRDEIILPMFDESYSEICIKGSTRPGKGCAVAIGVLLWFDVYDPSKIIISSATHAHAKKVMFAEIAKWRRKMHEPLNGRVLITELADTPQHYVIVSNPITGEGFSGQHGPRTLFVFDEATSINKERYEDAQKQARKIVAIGNPRTLSGWFYDLWRPCGFDKDTSQSLSIPSGKRRVVTIGGLDCLNVKHSRLERPVSPSGGIEIDGTFYPENERLPEHIYQIVAPLIPNQLDLGRFRSICKHPDSRHVDVFAHGKFPREDPEKQVILPSWLPRHIDAWESAKRVVKVDAFGFDVNRSIDGDKSVLSAGSEDGCAGQDVWRLRDVVQNAVEIIRIAKEKYGIDLTRGNDPVVVDVIGYGAGTVDALKERGVFVIEFDGSARSEFPEYVNLRAEGYAMLGRRLNPLDTMGDKPWMIPNDVELHEEICAPEKVHPGGDVLRFKLTPKDEIASNLQRSPDKGDSLVYLYHGVRWCETWGGYNDGDLVASGEDIEEERKRMTDEEIEDLEFDDLADILRTQRADQAGRWRHDDD